MEVVNNKQIQRLREERKKSIEERRKVRKNKQPKYRNHLTIGMLAQQLQKIIEEYGDKVPVYIFTEKNNSGDELDQRMLYPAEKNDFSTMLAHRNKTYPAEEIDKFNEDLVNSLMKFGIASLVIDAKRKRRNSLRRKKYPIFVIDAISQTINFVNEEI